MYIYVYIYIYTYRLVDTAGLTRIRTDKALLESKDDIKKRKIQDSIGKQRIQVRPGEKYMYIYIYIYIYIYVLHVFDVKNRKL
jgi:hypothetical protein